MLVVFRADVTATQNADDEILPAAAHHAVVGGRLFKSPVVGQSQVAVEGQTDRKSNTSTCNLVPLPLGFPVACYWSEVRLTVMTR